MNKAKRWVFCLLYGSVLLFFLSLLSSCGATCIGSLNNHAKQPPNIERESTSPSIDVPALWSGSLIEESAMEHVRVYIKGNLRTITLNMKDVDEDVHLLLTEYYENKGTTAIEHDHQMIEELSVEIPESGTYMLVIEKTKQ